MPKDKTPTESTELPEEVEEEEEEPTIASPPSKKPHEKKAVKTEGEKPPLDSWDEDDGSAKLTELLSIFGVPDEVSARIVRGYKVLGPIRSHPANLYQFLISHFYKQPALQQHVPVMIQAMMPYLGETEADSPLPYYSVEGAPARRGSPSGFYGDYEGTRYLRRPWDRYEQQDPAAAHGERESPAIKELRTMVTTLTETLQAEREERRQKEAEEERRQEREAAEARYAAVSDQVGALDARLGELVAAKVSEQHEQAQSGLAQEVSDLRKSLADRQSEELRSENASLRAQLEELRDTLGGIALKMEQLRAAPAGRTAEDLIADLGPVILGKVDSIGENVKGELAGWRDKMTPGGVSLQGPGLRPPADKGANPAAATTSPVDEAHEIARRTEAAQAFLRARAATSAAAKPQPQEAKP